MSKAHWIPLESNPEVMTSFAQKLGLDTSKLQFQDILSTDDWALEMVSTPVYAVIMVYPIKPESEERSRVQKEKIISDGQTVSPEVCYITQTVANACGTVAVLHAIGNSPKQDSLLSYEPNSMLHQMFGNGFNKDILATDCASAMSPTEMISYLETSEEMDSLHKEIAEMGETKVPEELAVNTHFICFSCVDGHLYELDGRKAFAINHGPLPSTGTEGTDALLTSAIRIIRSDYMDKDPEELRFTLLALTATPVE